MKKRIVSLLLAVTLVFSTPFVTNVKAMDLAKHNADKEDIKLSDCPDGVKLDNYVTSEEEFQDLVYKFIEKKTTEFSISSSFEVYNNVCILDNTYYNVYYMPIMPRENDVEINTMLASGEVKLKIIDIDYIDCKNTGKFVKTTFKLDISDAYEELEVKKNDFIQNYYNKDMSDYDKALTVLKYISENVEYASGYYTPYEALVNGRGLCTGFSAAYVYLATSIGLETYTVTGTWQYLSTKGSHAWSAVKICNNWYEFEPQESTEKNSDLRTFLKGIQYMDMLAYDTTSRDKLFTSISDYNNYDEHNYTDNEVKWIVDGDNIKAVFYKKCRECGEYESNGIEDTGKTTGALSRGEIIEIQVYNYLNREYIGTDCNVTKEWEHTCGEGTVTKYSCSVEIDGKEYTDVHFVQNGNCDHKKSESKITKEATCTEKGTVTYTCDCGYEWDEDTDFASCKYEAQKPVDVETCSDHYHLERSKCSECGALEYSTMTLYPATHDWHYQSTTKEATCTLKGNDVYECGRCHTTQNREVAAKGHGETYVADVDLGDCGHSSYSGNTYCKVCNKIIKRGTYNSDCVGHDYKYDTVEWDEYEPLIGNLLELNHYTLKVTTCKKDNCNYRYEDAKDTTNSGKHYTEKTFKSWKMANGKVVNVKAGYNQEDYGYTTDKDGNMYPFILAENNQSGTEKQTGKNNTSKPKKDTKPKNNKVTANKVTLNKPGKVTNLKVTSKKKALKLSWKKASNAKKYEIWICTNKEFKSGVIKKFTSKTSITVKKLKGKKKYYVKVRAVNVSGKKTKNGSWSGVINKKTKK